VPFSFSINSINSRKTSRFISSLDKSFSKI
jgi:hypothetical protein